MRTYDAAVVVLTVEELDALDVLLTQVPGVRDYLPDELRWALLAKIRAPHLNEEAES